MNERQKIIEWKRGYFRQIEMIYAGMVKRVRPDSEALRWAKAWRLEKLRTVCQKAQERLRQCQSSQRPS